MIREPVTNLQTEPAVGPVATGEVAPANVRLIRFLGRYGTPLVLVLELVGFSLIEGEYFLTLSNFSNVITQSAISILVALGLTWVLVAGEFDLSVGYMASFAGMFIATELHGDLLQWILVLAVLLAFAVLLGVLNGTLVTRLGIAALVATLGSGSLVLGINYLYSSGFPRALSGTGAELIQLYLGDFLGIIPFPIIILIVVGTLCWLLLNRTSFGLELQAVGSNPVAAALSGIDVPRVKTAAFVLCAIMASFGGIMITANSGSGSLIGGDSYLMSSFAACFLGSTALRNGEFHVLGTLLGVLTVAAGFNGLALLGVQASAQYLFQGGLLIAAVGMSTAARRLGGQGR
jgi:ribose transport system permease protein